MLQSVAHHQEVYVEQKVIYGYLVEHLLGDGDVGRLVLDNHPGTQVAAIEHAVGTQHLVAAFELNLVGKQSGRIALVLYEEVAEMLAHPLLGRARHVFSAQHIQDSGLLSSARNLDVESWQV